MSEILAVKNVVAQPQNFVSFVSQMVLLTQIAHIEQLFVVFLEKT